MRVLDIARKLCTLPYQRRYYVRLRHLVYLLQLGSGFWGAMKARRLIEGVSFGPEQLKTITKAFDDAWDQIAPNVSSRAEAVEAGRLRLASIVLSVAKRGILESKLLTDEALRLMSFPATKL